MTKKQKIFAGIVLFLCFLGSSYLESEMQEINEITRADFNEQMALINR